ncbi:L,D-transpeptidase [Synechococcus sp. CS-1328]|uniref:L,D-transpeptidase n=1 Tax=Synechococcus sp. CS-1328 TaxID=2847976 RepID=UPI00223B6851|nr:L,D-transpeptidase family protein [Synechococcus sp. CS-1328]MCT0225117.1 L,D-transpeptidase family protein [Synechococcus sp. CS-1328]
MVRFLHSRSVAALVALPVLASVGSLSLGTTAVAAEPSTSSLPAATQTRSTEFSATGSAATQPTPGLSAPATTLPSGTTPAGTGAGDAATAPITREILLELGRRTISLRENGKVISSWPVAIGDPGTPTPTGRFKVENKVVNPQYQSTKSGKINPVLGANGPLGDRWIGFKSSGANQYGIHGTPSAWSWTVSSRSAVTNGCVRMLSDHVRKLFELVEVGTPVVVTR